MDLGTYWLNQIPGQPLVISVLDSTGTPVNLNNYTSATLRMLGSDNEEVDTSGGVVEIFDAGGGRLRFYWPTNKSLLTKAGEYVVQVELRSATARDFTTPATLRVRKLGGK